MPENRPRVEPLPVVELVEEYVRKEIADAAQFENSTPLDESGIWDLHALAARIYARGWTDGEAAQSEKDHRARRRVMDGDN